MEEAAAPIGPAREGTWARLGRVLRIEADHRPPSPALVIVDVQRGFLAQETEAVVARIEAFLAERPPYEVVIATRFVNLPGSRYESERDWHELMSDEETELLPFVASRADVVLAKHGLGPDGSELSDLLRARGITAADLCGLDTDQCVLATAFDLWDAGIVPRLLADLCAYWSGPGMHDAGLAIARRSFGDRNVRTAIAEGRSQDIRFSPGSG